MAVVQQNQGDSDEDCSAGCPLCEEKRRAEQNVVTDYDYTEARGTVRRDVAIAFGILAIA